MRWKIRSTAQTSSLLCSDSLLSLGCCIADLEAILRHEVICSAEQLVESWLISCLGKEVCS